MMVKTVKGDALGVFFETIFQICVFFGLLWTSLVPDPRPPVMKKVPTKTAISQKRR